MMLRCAAGAFLLLFCATASQTTTVAPVTSAMAFSKVASGAAVAISQQLAQSGLVSDITIIPDPLASSLTHVGGSPSKDITKSWILLKTTASHVDAVQGILKTTAPDSEIYVSPITDAVFGLVKGLLPPVDYAVGGHNENVVHNLVNLGGPTNDKVVTVFGRKDAPITFSVTGNAGTGYVWMVDTEKTTKTLNYGPFEVAKPAEMPGGVVEQRIVVTPTVIGKATFVLKYTRPWSGSVAAVKTVEFDVPN